MLDALVRSSQDLRWIGAGAGMVGLGVGLLVNDNLLVGVAAIGSGVAAISFVAGVISDNGLLVGVELIGLGAAAILQRGLVLGVALIGAGAAVVSALVLIKSADRRRLPE